jgi:hypothetical protein
MYEKLKHQATRAALFAGAFVTTAIVMAGVGALFHGESRQTFLRDTPMARAALAACRAQAASHVPAGCVQEQLALARQRAQSTTLAAADDPAPLERREAAGP